jgi:D-galactose 1-dehydrogenase
MDYPEIKDLAHSFGIVGFGTIGKLYLKTLKEVLPECGLIAVADPALTIEHIDSIPVYSSLAELLNSGAGTLIVATPPALHFEIARTALECGRNVLIEKPPARSTREAEILIELSQKTNRTLFFAYHARYNTSVSAGRVLLQDQNIKSFHVVYRENVLKFHPSGWVLREGVVRDSGINVFSILVTILPFASGLRVCRAKLTPSKCGSESDARIDLSVPDRYSGSIEMQWCYPGPEQRTIEVQTNSGNLVLDIFKDELTINGARRGVPGAAGGMEAEYRRMTADFINALDTHASCCGTLEIRLVESTYETSNSRDDASGGIAEA